MTIQVNTTNGYAYTTVFKFSFKTNADISYSVWNLGEGKVVEDVSSVQHTYYYPGEYTVQCKIIDFKGVVYTQDITITVESLANDCLVFTKIPSLYREAGQPSDIFTVCVTSTQIDKPVVLDLNAINSSSLPFDYVDSRWDYLVPRWRFLNPHANIYNNNFEVITDTTVQTTPLTAYNTDNKIVTYALSGTYSFRYIDDRSEGIPQESKPLILSVTMQTSGYSTPLDSTMYRYESFSNSTVNTAVVWQVNSVVADSVRITSNLLEPIHTLKWKDVKIPFLLTAHSKKLNTTIIEDETIAFNYPTETSDVSTHVVLLTSHDGHLFNVAREGVILDPTNFQYKDSQNIGTTGYVYSTITPLAESFYAKISACSSSVDHVRTQALTSNQFIYPYEYPIQPNAWVCNPLDNVVTCIQLSVISEKYKDLIELHAPTLILGSTKTHQTNITKTYSTFSYHVTGESGTGPTAVDISNSTYPNSVIVLDTMHDCVYRFTTIIKDGVETHHTITCSLQKFENELEVVFEEADLVPASLSIDKYSCVWIALYNVQKVIKLDGDFNLLAIAKRPSQNTIKNGDTTLKPFLVETDKDSNVWVVYEGTTNTYLVKYNTNGDILLTQTIESIRPTGLVVDNLNRLWFIGCIASTNTVDNYTGYNNSVFIHLDTNGSIIQTVKTNYKNGQHLAIDRVGNIWFLHGMRGLGCFIIRNNTFLVWNIDVDGSLYKQNYTTIEQTGEFNGEIRGLSIDVYDRLWIVDSNVNTAICINAVHNILLGEKSLKTVVNITPNNKTDHYITYDRHIKPNTTIYNKSARSYGDFTGNKWLQKYTTATDTIQITGVSDTFTINNLNNNKHDVRVKNENFDMSNYLTSLALPEYMQNFTNFYKQVLTPAVGDNTYIEDNVGLKVYERISNFVNNTADIDTCDIKHILSHAQALGVDDVVPLLAEIPSTLERLLNITSIHHQKLWGQLSIPPVESVIDVSQLIPLTPSDIITAGDKLGAFNLLTNKLTVFTAPVSTLSIDKRVIYAQTYPLSSMTSYSLGYANMIADQFDIFNLNDISVEIDSSMIKESVIDWENPYTTINFQASTVDEWYGDNCEVETMFNMELTRYMLSLL